MKRIVLFIALVFNIMSCFAQKGEIIYVNNPSPDLLHPYVPPGYALYDIDGNGTQDLWIGVPNFYWYCVRAYTVGDMQFYCKLHDQFVHPGDTLALMPEWCWYNAPEDPWGDKTSKVDPTIIVDYGEDVDSAFIGVRRLVEGSYCYGWMRISTEVDNAPDPNNKSKCYIHDYAFCTDPNYPFRAGQTSFDWVDIKETEAKSFVTVQPNPTTGMVTISGEDIQNIEVYDLVGQRVLKQVPGNDNINVDFSGQPAGIYLINVTGKDGRRCVKRIIKQ